MRIKYNGRAETLKWAEPRGRLLVTESLDGGNCVFDMVTDEQAEASFEKLCTHGYTDLTNFEDISDEYYDD